MQISEVRYKSISYQDKIPFGVIRIVKISRFGQP